MAADDNARVRPVTEGDPNWLDAHASLKQLHIMKSRTYGTPRDTFANFNAVDPDMPERYVIQRTIEKLARAQNMIAAGNAEAVNEYMDCASLMLCAEALRRRRFT